MTATAAPAACPQCGTHLGPALLSCPQCRWLVHGAALKQLAAEAERAEQAGDLATAASKWQDALQLLPQDARQAEVIAKRMHDLGERMVQSPAGKAKAPAWARGGGAIGLLLLAVWKFKFLVVLLLTKAKLLLLGLTKMSTLLSMFAAFGVYWQLWGWQFAAGLLVSIYIHEMGHVASLAHYGIKASPPMFIPGLGAVVRLKQYPPTPALDARVGLAGPIWGLGAALAALGIHWVTGAEIWAAIARSGAWINLFNLLPFWQLDGGRGFHALNRHDRWMAVGLIGTAWFISHESLLVLLLIAAVVQAFGKAPEKRDLPVLIQYGVLVAVLTALTRLAVATP